MFADPQSLTINAVATSLPRVESDGTSSRYSSADENVQLRISHQKSKRGNKTIVRTLVAASQRAVVPDPLTSVNDYETLGINFVIDRPENGFSATQVDHLVQALKTWLSTANVTALFGQQS